MKVLKVLKKKAAWIVATVGAFIILLLLIGGRTKAREKPLSYRRNMLPVPTPSKQPSMRELIGGLVVQMAEPEERIRKFDKAMIIQRFNEKFD